ncbi:MAG: hypothetical protein IT289_02700 [Oligoflexia bacterium]|nr:hypothetical protein [Oligoflexia bacterium]
MSEEKKEETKSPVQEFRLRLKDIKKLKETVLEGLGAKNGKIRALAAKAAFKLKDHAFVKKNVLPLIESEKSTKVLKAIGDKIKRDKLFKNLEKLYSAKPKAKKAEAAEGSAEAPKA